MRYTVVFERGEDGYGAYVPDLPGCIAVGETMAETRTLIQEAIVFHIEGLLDAGSPVPPPTSTAEIIEVEAA